MKIPSNVLAFAGAENMTPYMQFKDYFNHYRANNGKKMEYDTSLSFSEKEEKVNASLKEEIARVANVTNFSSLAPEVWASNPTVAWASFAVVGAYIDMILPETLIDSIGIYTDVRFGAMGDSFSFDIKPRDLFVISKAGRAKRTTEVHKQYVGQVTVVPELRSISVQVSLYKVLCGKESLADFIMKCVRSLESKMALDTYTAFDTAMTALPTTPVNQDLKTTGYSQDVLVNYAQKVTAFNGGAKAVVIGTQLAVSKVLPMDNNYRYDLNSDYVKMGYVQSAFGYDIMALPQVADWENPFGLALKDDRLYVVSPSSNKIVKLCIEGATTSNVGGVYDNANLTQNATVNKAWKAAIATNSIAAEIII